ncbi:MAG: glycine zipper 2TM domain-containing protein [Alphaproteobacteria bacterium]|nr:glycine zipper 2TM domain-containing protein [Alphaproteobacteria bacterium]
MKAQVIGLIMIASLGLAGCAQNGQENAWGMGNKQTMGALGGAVIGGTLGSHVGKGSGKAWMTGVGTLLGALAGSSIGQSLDQADRMYANQAMNRAYDAPLNSTVKWDNPQSGHSGSYTPIREGVNSATGYRCREYKQSIFVDGQAQTATGQACQQSDGSWKVIN